MKWPPPTLARETGSTLVPAWPTFICLFVVVSSDVISSRDAITQTKARPLVVSYIQHPVHFSLSSPTPEPAAPSILVPHSLAFFYAFHYLHMCF